MKMISIGIWIYKLFRDNMTKKLYPDCSNCGRKFSDKTKRDNEYPWYCIRCANYHRKHFPWLFIKKKKVGLIQ